MAQFNARPGLPFAVDCLPVRLQELFTASLTDAAAGAVSSCKAVTDARAPVVIEPQGVSRVTAGWPPPESGGQPQRMPVESNGSERVERTASRHGRPNDMH